ncbi:MAG: heme exporter protein CcmB [Thermaurantiacus sp.]
MRLARRDLARMAARPGEWLLPAAFFLLVSALFPFGVGADRELLGRIAAGVLWVAALLAALLPVTALYGTDAADGTLDQYAVRGIAGETLALARLAALWLGVALPLLAALPIAALMLGLPPAQWPSVAGGLALGLGGLAALANIAGALTLGARGGGGLAGIIVLPLAIPVLVFGAGAGQGGAAFWLAASVLLLVAIAPFAVGQALAASRS